MAAPSLPTGNGTMIPPPILLEDPDAVPPTPVDNETLRRYLKELELKEFYSTYDVWTGIRTAVTLALFFVFTVTLILYKSKCKPRRKYELYPSLEDMPGRPLDYYDYWCHSPVSNEMGYKVEGVDALGRCYNGRGETGSAPLPKRSIGSYSSLNNSFRVKSLPGSVMRINCSRNSSFERDDSSQVTVQSVRSEFLSVPGVRLQSTGSSSDGSSIHDLPGDSRAMGLLGVPGMGPPRGTKPLLQLGGMDFDSDHATAEWVQTIDINVIQPTPNISPCGSVRSVSDSSELARLALPGRGRVASVASLDSPDLDNRSIGSDSVFLEDSTVDTCSSMSGSVDSGSPSSLLASPRSPGLAPSQRARPGGRKVQSFRLGIAPSAAPFASVSHRQRQLKRQKKKQQQQQDVPAPTAAATTSSSSSVVVVAASSSSSSSLLVPSLANPLSASCERLAAHSAVMAGCEESRGGRGRGSGLLAAPGGSTEEEPTCAVFTVPSLRRSNSATTPKEEQQEEEARGFRRADSEQNPAVKRADSAADPRRRSSDSSSESDEASESVSFHLMVPALSVDNPSNDTSRASSPTLSPPASPNGPSPTPQLLCALEPPTPTPAPSWTAGGRRQLRRQYSQCLPPSPTLLRDASPSPSSLPTYVEEADACGALPFPTPPPPPSPFRAGYSPFFLQEPGPPSPRSEGYRLFGQDSSPGASPRRSASRSSSHRHQEDSSSLSSSQSGLRSNCREGSSASSPAHSRKPNSQDSSSPPSPKRPSGQPSEREDSRPSSPSSSSVRETSC